MTNPTYPEFQEILYIKKIVFMRAENSKKPRKTKGTSDDDLYIISPSTTTGGTVEPRRSERIQMRQLAMNTNNDHLQFSKEETKGEQDKRSKKKSISEGWCTPWAETLDSVNIYYFGISDNKLLTDSRKYAKNLGAGETENIEKATHIITEPSIDISIISDSVILY
jgi:hypothetical protein